MFFVLRRRPFTRDPSFCLHRHLHFEQLESRRVLAWVTLITHGYAGNVTGWVSAMADAIDERTIDVDHPRYVMEVTDPHELGGSLDVTMAWQGGPGPAANSTANPEIIVLLDWSDVAGALFSSRVRSTSDVAVAVADAFATPDLIQNLTAPLAELPLHLIGHSRGGSLVGAIAKELGKMGIWVDHVTTLDPHPVDGVTDPLGQDFGEAASTAWALRATGSACSRRESECRGHRPRRPCSDRPSGRSARSGRCRRWGAAGRW